MNNIKFREILRLISKTDFSNRRIARLISVSPNTVKRYRDKVKESAHVIDDLLCLDDHKLEESLKDTVSFMSDKRMPDWGYIHKQMQYRHQTLLRIWEDYCISNPQDAYSYSQFTYHYRKHTSKISLSMRQQHYAGEAVLVDYAGRTVEWTDMQTHEVHKAQIFVAVMGCSNYTFAFASKSQKLEDWIDAHVKMYEFLGGSPQTVICDNLKSAVTKGGLFPTINRSYMECIKHYESVIDPARVRKPKDKAKAESGVLFICRWILAALSNHRFFSIDEINDAIAPLLDRFNERPFKDLPGNRKSRFEEFDKPELRPLPDSPFEYAEWVTKQKVRPDYHVLVQKHNYSVPFRLVSEIVEARVTTKVVEIFHLNKRIAVHPRSDVMGGQTTNPDHSPASHHAYASLTKVEFMKWALSIGPCAMEVVDKQFEHKADHSIPAKKACVQLKKLARIYTQERFENACLRALQICSPTATTVGSILKNHMDKVEGEEMPVQEQLPLHYNVRGAEYYSVKGAQR
jgi:transposase